MLETISERRRFLAKLQKAREAATGHGTHISQFLSRPSLSVRHTNKLDNVLF